jgi:cell division protein FtsI (penicillin-binding protein 3)
LIVMLAVVGAVLLAVVVRVGLLQTAEADDFQAYGLDQRVRTVPLAADRGVVFDRNGVELALSVPATTIWANPRAITEDEETVAVLAELLGLSEQRQERLLEQLRAKDADFVYVARQLDAAQAQSVLDLGLKGIGGYTESKRLLPAGDSARGIVGTTDIDGAGIAGIEGQYDGVLTGVAGTRVRETDEKGRSIPTGRRTLVAPVPGNDLVLTIDRKLQFISEQALIEMVSQLGAKGGTAQVMESSTGELLAIANVSRDPDTGEVRVSSANISAVDSFEPGSVAKVITVAAALNEGTVTPDSTFVVPDSKRFYDTVLHDAAPHGTESMTVSRILAKSSNIGTMLISETIGVERQEQYMRAFGLGDRTALDFPGESRGILKPSSEWQGTERVTVSYGQGVSATGVQLLSAVNTIANDGVYIAPKLVRAIIDQHGEEHATAGSATREVIRPEIAEQMTTIMRKVICDGTASRANVPGYNVAGKTGTGLKAQANGTYEDENGRRAYFASFVGFVPAENPRFTIQVSIDEPPPDGPRYGGLVAAPVFVTIASAALQEYQVPPPTVGGGCPGK